jgi:hypothetical protein
MLLALAGVVLQWPKVLAIPVGVMLGWVASALLVRVVKLSVYGRRRKGARARRGRGHALAHRLNPVPP